MKKKIAFAALAIAMTIPSFADEILIADNAEGTESWFAYPETFTVMKDAYSVLGLKRFNREKRNDLRMYFAVSFEDCKKGFGTLYSRDNPKQNWEMLTQFNVAAGRTIGDVMATEICETGKEISKPTKKPAQSPVPQAAAKKVSI